MGRMLRPESRELNPPSSPASCRRAGGRGGVLVVSPVPEVKGGGGKEPADLRTPTSTLCVVLADQARSAQEEQGQETLPCSPLTA